MMQETLDGSEYILPTSDEWETPQELFDELNEEFHFTLDPCASDDTYKVERFFVKEDNGLIQPWLNHTVFMNCPYSDIPSWVEKAFISWNDGAKIVALLPAWTDRGWFHDFIYKPYRKGKIDIRFLRGRVRFLINGIPKKSPRFASMVVIFK